MELVLMLDALKRSSPSRVTSVIPYFGYARQDRKHGPREPITARLMADLISVAGTSRVLFLDLHATQIQGFFNIPADNLRPDAAFVAYLQEKNLTGENTTVVAANAGGVRRAQRVASRMKAKIAILEYRTVDAQRSMNVVGTLKENVVMIDDMIDTGSRLILGAAHLKSVGAKKVFACAAHPVLSGSIEKLQESQVDEFAVTDSIPVPPEKMFPKLKVLSVAQTLAEAIRRLHHEESMSDMFY
jgi:ribose-phosphate pyrophosphokinase